MTIRLNPRWLLLSALLFSLQTGRAQVVVPPTLSFNLGTSVLPQTRVWDLSGGYSVNLTVTARNGLTVPIQLSFSLVQGIDGKLTNPFGDVQGLIINNDDNSQFAIFPVVNGKVTGSGEVVRVHFTVRFNGPGTFGGVQNVNVSGSLTVDAEVDPFTGQLQGTKLSSFSASFGGANGISGKSNFASTLPGTADGSWNLNMTLAGLTKLTGLGVVTTPNRTLGYDLKGKYQNGIFNLKANGASDVPGAGSGKGSNLGVLMSPNFDTLQISGKLLGQKISFNIFTGSPTSEK